MTGLAIQVARWTPLVTCPMGTVSQCRPGQRSRQMLRETWPWRRDTPLTPADRRMAVTVMWNWPGRSGCVPSRKKVSRSIPISFHTGPATLSSCSIENASWPAGTGVWVVNTLWARTWCTASSSDRPCFRYSRRRSTIMNAACPSLACQTPGFDAHRAQHAHAADAEDPLLPEPHVRARRRRACS